MSQDIVERLDDVAGPAEFNTGPVNALLREASTVITTLTAERDALATRLEIAYRVKAECNDEANFQRSRALAAEALVQSMREALEKIAGHTDPDDPESYRCDDREGCLDTVQSIARAALSRSEV